MMKLSETSIIVLKYRSLLNIAESMYVSQKKAVKFVRGEKRLQRLVEEGQIRCEKPYGASNTMWRYNLADILKNVKTDMRLNTFDLETV